MPAPITWTVRPTVRGLHQWSIKRTQISPRRGFSTNVQAIGRLRQIFLGTAATVAISVAYFYVTDTRASIHKSIFAPLLRAAYPDAEEAHEKTISILKTLHAAGVAPRERPTAEDDDLLSCTVFGWPLCNPIGISGGLDKHGDIPDALLALGPSIVEIGGITPHPQQGNPKPRVFRIPSEQAIINRYGLNSQGADVVAGKLRQRVRRFAQAHGLGLGEQDEQAVLDGHLHVPPGSLQEGRLLAIQIAKNKTTSDNDLDAVVQDHVTCVEKLGKYADIIVVNVSSPNTPGLRTLQAQAPLTRILSEVVMAARKTSRKTSPAVMVKVSPDEDTEAQVRGICEAVWAAGVNGIIVGNTTNLRPESLLQGNGLSAEEALVMRQHGGFSGPHLFERTARLVSLYRQTLASGPQSHMDVQASRQFDNNIVLFASGGITDGKRALEILNAGASVAMVYTGLTYDGVGFITKLKSQMRTALEVSR